MLKKILFGTPNPDKELAKVAKNTFVATLISAVLMIATASTIHKIYNENMKKTQSEK